MTPIDMLSAYVIGGIGSLAGALMMAVAMQSDRRHRGALRRCTWGFALLGAGMVHSGFADRDLRWPILSLALAALLGTLWIYRGLGVLAGTQAIGRSRLALETLVLAGTLVLAWTLGPRPFSLVFHVLCLAVAVGMVWVLRRALFAPRNAVEPTVTLTLAMYACSWALALVAALRHEGPEHRYLIYVRPPLDTVYAVLFAVLPLLVAAMVLNLANARLSERLRRLANIDPLTGLLSRRALLDRAGRWREGVRAQGRVPVLLLMDVDHFKAINDGRGHDAGDEVLRLLGQRLPGQLRQGSLLGRYGGEEFLALVDTADADEAQAVAARLREAVAAQPFEFAGQPFAVTLSIGLAPWRADEDLAPAIARADAALYAAKRGGRDRVVAHAGLSAPAAPAP